jgi:hypothetical protein
MSDARLRWTASSGLVTGALLGMAGTFAPSAPLRGLAWGIDGTALVAATALLAVHHLREGREQLAAGFLVFMVGETLAAGAALWAAALALVSAAPSWPLFVRVTGALAALLFAATAVRMFGGAPLTALSTPLPFYAYPFLAITLFGWAWVHVRGLSPSKTST